MTFDKEVEEFHALLEKCRADYDPTKDPFAPFSDEPPTVRWTFSSSDGGRVGVSVSLYSTKQDLQNVKDSIAKATAEVRAFEAQSEEEKLRYYLSETVQALDEICTLCQIDVRTAKWPETELEKELNELRLKIFGKAERVLLFTPSSYKQRNT